MELKATIRANTTFVLGREFAKLAKRATKLGVSAPTLTIGKPYNKEIPVYANESARAHGISHGTTTVQVCDVVIAGEAPKLQGWSFVTRLERLPGAAENLLTGVPGTTLPEQYRHTDAALCEHCNTRRIRKATYVMHNEAEGRYMQVGHSCLRDFTGTNSPDKLLKGWMTCLDGFGALLGEGRDEEGRDFCYRGSDMQEAELVLAWTLSVVEWSGGYKFKPKDGWGVGTGDMVWTHMFVAASPKEERAPFPTEAQFAKAREVRQFLRDLTPNSDYERNLKIMACADFIGPRQVRMLASGVYSWLKAQEATIDRPTCNEYVGHEKDRLRGLKLEVVRTFTVDSDFGEAQVAIMKDDQGRTFKAKFTGTHRYVKPATRIELTGTVKSHSEYQGTRQTVLTRCEWDQIDGNLKHQPGMVGVKSTAPA